MYINCNICGCL